MASVELKNLEKSFGPVEVIHNLNISIADGDFVVLVGPSGCGKSTLLRILAGLEDATDGDILIGGNIVNHQSPRERNVAMVFQSYALYPHMSVRDNIGFNLELSKLSKGDIAKRVEEAARQLEISDLLSRKPAQLSGGQRQRVAMGRAIVRDPAVFLFDEPLSNLDAQMRVQMRAEIKLLHEKIKTTVIYVTHDQIEAMTLADRIVVLNGGRIEQQGTPLELYMAPANIFVAGFIGSPSMNFLNAAVALEDNNPVAILSDGTRIDLNGNAQLKNGQEIVVGIRPEHLTPGGVGTRLAGPIRLIEPTGAQTHVRFQVAGQDVMAVIDGTTEIDKDHPFEINIAPSLIHIFDKHSTNRLNRSQ